MTVNELITELKNLPSDLRKLPVLIRADAVDGYEITTPLHKYICVDDSILYGDCEWDESKGKNKFWCIVLE